MLYKPNQLYPKNIGINPLVDNIFSWKTNGTLQTDYRIYIYNNTTSALLYDSGKITSSLEYMTLPASTLSTGIECKWYVKTYAGVEEQDSDYAFLKTVSLQTIDFYDPVFTSPTPLELTTQYYTFKCNYSQAENISIKKFKMSLYDINENEISSSDWIYDFNIEYEFTGMVNGLSYKIKCFSVSQDDIEESTDFEEFYINYISPSDTLSITITSDNYNGNNTLSWENLKRVLPVANNESYITGKFKKGLKLSSGYLTYSEEFTNFNYTLTFWFKLQYGKTGNFLQIATDQYLGYEQSSNKFYYTNNINTYYSEAITLYTIEDFSTDLIADYTGDIGHLSFTSTDYCFTWLFIGLKYNKIIIKVNEELITEININT